MLDSREAAVILNELSAGYADIRTLKQKDVEIALRHDSFEYLKAV